MVDQFARQKNLQRNFSDQALLDVNSQKGREPIGENQPASPGSYKDPDIIEVVKKANYAKELQFQIHERQEKRYHDIKNERMNDMRLLKERFENDPFGKPGAGAPLRDKYGNIITVKNKVLQHLYEHPPDSGMFSGPKPVFSLKARLARENLLVKTYDLDGSQADNDINQRSMSQPQMPSNFAASQNAYPPSAGNMPSSFMPPSSYPFYPPPQPPIIFFLPPSPFAQPQPQPQSMSSLTDRGINNEPWYPEDKPFSIKIPSRRLPSVERGLPYPGTDKFHERDEKKKRIMKHVAHQNDLLRQIEEKQRQKEHEEELKKLEDDLDEERVQRENNEIREKDQDEINKRRNFFDKLQQPKEKIRSGFDFVITKKSNAKRERTSIEEVEKRMQNENSALIQNKDDKDKEKEANKKPLNPIEEKVVELKEKLNIQQAFLQDQLLDVKKKLLDMNLEKTLNSYEIEDLRHKLKQQRVIDEIRRLKLYEAMVNNKSVPAILPTAAWVTPGNKTLNDRKHFPISTRLVEPVTSRPPSNDSIFNGTESGLNYLDYFGNPDNSAIPVNSNYWSLPDNNERMTKSDIYTPYRGSETIRTTLERNKEKLEVLEDLEHKKPQPYAKKLGLERTEKPKSRVDDEISQILDDFLVSVNASQKFAERFQHI